MSLELQAGAGSIVGSYDQQQQIVALKVKCYGANLTDALVGEIPSGIGVDLPCVMRNFERRAEGEGFDVYLNLEGHLNPSSANGLEYGLQGALANEPIETNPNYLELLDLYDGDEDPSTNRGKWPKTLATADGEERNPMHGVEDYRNPGLIWSKKWTSLILPASLVRDLGSLTESPPGNPPELDGRHTWLKIRANAVWRGNVWQIEEAWELVGKHAIAPELYRHR